MTCQTIRCNDEMQCRCGLTWSIDECKPPCRRIKNTRMARHTLSELKELLKYEKVSSNS